VVENWILGLEYYSIRGPSKKNSTNEAENDSGLAVIVDFGLGEKFNSLK
jgi:hypothetical protein